MSNIERKSVYSIRYMLISCQSETYNEVINRVGLKAYGLILNILKQSRALLIADTKYKCVQ